jgi:hypothetical protein
MNTQRRKSMIAPSYLRNSTAAGQKIATLPQERNVREREKREWNNSPEELSCE